MGAYSPLPWAPPTLVDDIVRTVVQPTVDEMHRRGTPFAGLLYAGLALTSRGLRTVEFNARFGDPETQVVLARLLTPLGGVLKAAATGHLADLPDLRWTPTQLSPSWWPLRTTRTPLAPGTRSVVWTPPTRCRTHTSCTRGRGRLTAASSAPVAGCSRSSGREPTSRQPGGGVRRSAGDHAVRLAPPQ